MDDGYVYTMVGVGDSGVSPGWRNHEADDSRRPVGLDALCGRRRHQGGHEEGQVTRSQGFEGRHRGQGHGMAEHPVRPDGSDGSLSGNPRCSLPPKGLDTMQKISPFLWFDDNAEEAANLYVSLLKDSKIVSTTRYRHSGPGPRSRVQVMIVVFQLAGEEFIALNGGPDSSSPRRFRSPWTAIPSRKSTPSGRSSPRAARSPVRLARGPLRPLLADRPERVLRAA